MTKLWVGEGGGKGDENLVVSALQSFPPQKKLGTELCTEEQWDKGRTGHTCTTASSELLYKYLGELEPLLNHSWCDTNQGWKPFKILLFLVPKIILPQLAHIFLHYIIVCSAHLSLKSVSSIYFYRSLNFCLFEPCSLHIAFSLVVSLRASASDILFPFTHPGRKGDTQNLSVQCLFIYMCLY